MSQEVQNNVKVETIGDAIQVLIKAVDIGRQNGVYGWEDLAVIKKSIEIITAKPETVGSPAQETDSAISEDSAE